MSGSNQIYLRMHGNPITIRNLGPEDAHILDRIRPGTFQSDVDPARAWAFLATRVNELVVALDQGEVVGFASGTTMLRPDKPTAFFVDEVSIHPDLEKQGVEKRLMGRLTELALDRGCEKIWLMVDSQNKAARALYASLDGSERNGFVMYEWDH